MPEQTFADWWAGLVDKDGDPWSSRSDLDKATELCSWAFAAGVASEREAREKVEAAILVILEVQLKAKAVVEAAQGLVGILQDWPPDWDEDTHGARYLRELREALKTLGPAAEQLGQRP